MGNRMFLKNTEHRIVALSSSVERRVFIEFVYVSYANTVVFDPYHKCEYLNLKPIRNVR